MHMMYPSLDDDVVDRLLSAALDPLTVAVQRRYAHALLDMIYARTYDPVLTVLWSEFSHVHKSVTLSIARHM